MSRRRRRWWTMSDPGEEHGPALPRHHQALTEYLEELLRDVPDEEWDVEPPAGPPPRRARRTSRADPAGVAVKERVELPRAPLPKVAPPPPEPPASQPPPAAEPDPFPEFGPDLEPRSEPAVSVPEPVPEPEPAPTPAPAGGPGGPAEGETEDPLPAWSRPYFQALLFHVGPLRLAVPLIKLQSVVPWSDEISPAPRQPEWMHGLLFYRGKQVRVVNTAELVLPQDRRPPPEELEPRKLLVVGDGCWAFSCRDVSEVIKLEPDQVQWRSSRGRRRWLAGTVREHLCALMDADALAEMLDEDGEG